MTSYHKNVAELNIKKILLNSSGGEIGSQKTLCIGQGNPFELWQKTETDVHTATTSDSISLM